MSALEIPDTRLKRLSEYGVEIDCKNYSILAKNKDQQITILKNTLELIVLDWCSTDNHHNPNYVIKRYLKFVKGELENEKTRI